MVAVSYHRPSRVIFGFARCHIEGMNNLIENFVFVWLFVRQRFNTRILKGGDNFALFNTAIFQMNSIKYLQRKRGEERGTEELGMLPSR